VQEYEIRILRKNGSPAIIMAGIHPSDECAVRAARDISHGCQFEVWRGMECIAGLGRLRLVRET